MSILPDFDQKTLGIDWEGSGARIGSTCVSPRVEESVRLTVGDEVRAVNSRLDVVKVGKRRGCGVVRCGAMRLCEEREHDADEKPRESPGSALVFTKYRQVMNQSGNDRDEREKKLLPALGAFSRSCRANAHQQLAARRQESRYRMEYAEWVVQSLV